ncbi:AAA family ATPase [Nocardia gamkensis]|uniref:AAA family ATPase n=1 Tax=Nocardia gamkensis TaxID=352869 RepID=UPI0037CB0161
MTGDHDGTEDVFTQPQREALRNAVGGLGNCGAAVVCGFPASGKSTAANYLARVLGTAVLDKDRFAPLLEESVMARLSGDRFDRDSDTYRALIAPGIYDGLIRTGLTLAPAFPVVLDAPFLSTIRDAAAHEMALSDYLRAYTGLPEAVPVVTVWLDASPAVIRSRMLIRRAERDAPKLADWDAYHAGVLDSGVRELAHNLCHLVVPT